jgi:hypothetical protein
MLHLPEWYIIKKDSEVILPDGYYWYFGRGDTPPRVDYCGHKGVAFSVGDIIYGPILTPHLSEMPDPESLESSYTPQDTTVMGILVCLGQVVTPFPDHGENLFDEVLYFPNEEQARKYIAYLETQRSLAVYNRVFAIYRGRGKYQDPNTDELIEVCTYEEAVRACVISRLTLVECAILGITAPVNQ